MNDSCEEGTGYKCKNCAFSSDESSTCANPNIWERPPRDSYYKQRGDKLTIVEIESIEDHL